MDDTERDMFDTMTSTKIIAALCGTFLAFLLGKWAIETVYHVGPSGHGDEHHNAYVIATDEGAEEEAVEEVVDFATILAAADSDKGAKVFSKCKACHKLEAGEHGVGPSLFGVVGRDIATVDGFGFSSAVGDLPGNWTPEALSDFLENPKGYAPGTKMSFNGLSKIQDRANLISYLSTIGG